MKKFIFLILLAFFFTGCSTKYISRDISFTKQEDRVSFPLPSDEVKTITSFRGVMNTALWTEVVGTGGVWKVLGMTPERKILHGYAYLDRLDYWGKAYLRVDFAYPKAELEGARFLMPNADGFVLFKMSGELVGIKAEGKEELMAFDPKKFDEDEEYKAQVFNESGMTLDEVDGFWRKYFASKNQRISDDFTSVEEISRKKYNKRLSAAGWHFYDVEGSKRASYMPLDGFVEEAVKEDESTFGGMFAKNSKLFLPGLFNPFALATASVSLAGDAANAAVNKGLRGSSMRSQVERRDLAETFVLYELLVQDLLRERDAAINELKRENMRLKQRAEISRK